MTIIFTCNKKKNPQQNYLQGRKHRNQDNINAELQENQHKLRQGKHETQQDDHNRQDEGKHKDESETIINKKHETKIKTTVNDETKSKTRIKTNMGDVNVEF